MGLTFDIFLMCCGVSVMGTAAMDIMVHNMQLTLYSIPAIVCGGLLFFVSIPRAISGPQGGSNHEE